MFLALSFVIGIAEISTYLTTFVLGTEVLTPRIRIIFCSVGVSAFFAVGYMLLPLTAFFIRDWRMLLIAVAVPGVVYVPLWRLISESPRWLLSQGRVEEAEAILRGAAKKNGVKAPEVIFQPLQVENEEKVNHHSICDLVKFDNIRWITIILSFAWITISIGYFSLSLNTSNLLGDPFVNCFLSAAVEVPGYILSWPLLRSFPRRLSIFPMLIICGVSLLFTQLIPRELSSVSIALKMMGKFGFSLSFTLVYAYTAEVYPTVLRNTAVGTCSCISQLGNIAAPYLVYLGIYSKSTPYVLMGSLCILGGLLGFLLPETYGLPLPETIDDMQTIQSKQMERARKRNSFNVTEEWQLLWRDRQTPPLLPALRLTSDRVSPPTSQGHSRVSCYRPENDWPLPCSCQETTTSLTRCCSPGHQTSGQAGAKT
ncbi:hypothetical protein COCON_G00085120 [Conger conger]|uniref:Major facilitator superfamily (MFS) profile domain-containing protein n=1 Tax=Conger conger TaxID=82655 RepID=A0A9Q1DQI7_CONCO|nr:hypothetical protein COCON_G00085120 [Conger conger]